MGLDIRAAAARMLLVWATSVFTVGLGHQTLYVNIRATSARFL
jgi:hypothetical protein